MFDFLIPKDLYLKKRARSRKQWIESVCKITAQHIYHSNGDGVEKDLVSIFAKNGRRGWLNFLLFNRICSIVDHRRRMRRLRGLVFGRVAQTSHVLLYFGAIELPETLRVGELKCNYLSDNARAEGTRVIVIRVQKG